MPRTWEYIIIFYVHGTISRLRFCLCFSEENRDLRLRLHSVQKVQDNAFFSAINQYLFWMLKFGFRSERVQGRCQKFTVGVRVPIEFLFCFFTIAPRDSNVLVYYICYFLNWQFFFILE